MLQFFYSEVMKNVQKESNFEKLPSDLGAQINGNHALGPPGVFKNVIITELHWGMSSTCEDEKGQTMHCASMGAVLPSTSINEAYRAFMNRAFESPASKVYWSRSHTWMARS